MLGLHEKVTLIGDDKREITARIDTGATTSSLDISLASELKLGPIVSTKVIRSANGTKKRPIVHLKIVIDGKEMVEKVNLSDRSNMSYKMLVGQNILKKGSFLIDPLKD